MSLSTEPHPIAAPPFADQSLHFDATVPRQLVHRAAVAETFPTDATRTGDDRYLIAAQLPRTHSLYNDGPTQYHDLLLLSEVVRQAGTLVSHRFYDVPVGAIFPLRRAQIEISDLDALATTNVPGELVIDMTMSELKRLSGALTGTTMNARLVIDGRPVGTASGSGHFVQESSYAALRRNRPPAGEPAALSPVRPAQADRVGRGDLRNVVVGELRRDPDGPGRSCAVLADTSHPSFFDHPQDHLPGMLLLEAYRQTALLAVADACAWAPQSLLVIACDAAFLRFAELDLQARCTAIVGSPVLPRHGAAWVPVTLTLTQRGATLSEATVLVADVKGS